MSCGGRSCRRGDGAGDVVNGGDGGDGHGD